MATYKTKDCGICHANYKVGMYDLHVKGNYHRSHLKGMTMTYLGAKKASKVHRPFRSNPKARRTFSCINCGCRHTVKGIRLNPDCDHDNGACVNAKRNECICKCHKRCHGGR